MANSLLLEMCEPWASKNGEVELLMLPFTTFKANGVHDEFVKLVPRGEWSLLENAFLVFYIYVEDLKINGNTPTLRVLKKLWDIRDLPIEERWEFFKAIYIDALGDLIGSAYVATRDTTFQAPVPLHAIPKADAPGESKRATRRQSKTS